MLGRRGRLEGLVDAAIILLRYSGLSGELLEPADRGRTDPHVALGLEEVEDAPLLSPELRDLVVDPEYARQEGADRAFLGQVEQLADPFELETQGAEGDYPLEPGPVGLGVQPIARARARGGTQQPDRVVVEEGRAREPANLAEAADGVGRFALGLNSWRPARVSARLRPGLS